MVAGLGRSGLGPSLAAQVCTAKQAPELTDIASARIAGRGGNLICCRIGRLRPANQLNATWPLAETLQQQCVVCPLVMSGPASRGLKPSVRTLHMERAVSRCTLQGVLQQVPHQRKHRQGIRISRQVEERGDLNDNIDSDAVQLPAHALLRPRPIVNACLRETLF